MDVVSKSAGFFAASAKTEKVLMNDHSAGSYEGHIMSYNSIVAAEDGEVTNQETGAGTARARPWSRLAMVSHHPSFHDCFMCTCDVALS